MNVRERGIEREMGKGKAVTKKTEAEETGRRGSEKHKDLNNLSTAGFTLEEPVICTACVLPS